MKNLHLGSLFILPLRTFMSASFLTFFLVLLFCSGTSLQAQTTPQGWLNAVQQQIDQCKSDIDKTQARLDEVIAADPLTIYVENLLDERKKLEAQLAEQKECLKKAEKELEKIKSWYPALFLPVNTTIDTDDDNKGGGGKGKPKGKNDEALKAAAKKVQEALDAANSALEDLFKQVKEWDDK